MSLAQWFWTIAGAGVMLCVAYFVITSVYWIVYHHLRSGLADRHSVDRLSDELYETKQKLYQKGIL